MRAAEVEHRRAVEEVIEFVELERYRHQPVDALPFGLQKIVGFARALAMAPQVLLLDEPSAGLNREEREDLARHILRIRHERGLAMIWVEHDMQMVADLADRIHVLDYGRTLGRRQPGDGAPGSAGGGGLSRAGGRVAAFPRARALRLRAVSTAATPCRREKA